MRTNGTSIVGKRAMQRSACMTLSLMSILFAGCTNQFGLAQSRSADTSVAPGGGPDRVFYLGQGYDSSSQNFVGTCVVPNKPTSDGVRQGILTFDRSQDQDRTYAALGVDTTLKGHYKFFSASDTAKFATESTSDGYSDVINFIEEWETEATGFNPAGGKTLTGDGTTAQTGGNWNRVCGDQYVDQIIYGARFFMTYRVDFLSKDDHDHFNNELHVDAEKATWDIHFTNTIDSIAKHYGKRARVHLSVFQYGGDPSHMGQIVAGTGAPPVSTTQTGTSGTGPGAPDAGLGALSGVATGTAAIDCDITNLSACNLLVANAIKYASGDFQDQLKNLPPVPIGLVLKPYSTIAIVNTTIPILTTEIVRARSDLKDVYDRLLIASTRVGRLLNEQWDMPTSVQTQFTDLSKQLSSDIDLVNVAVQACWEDLIYNPDGTPVVATVDACRNAVKAVSDHFPVFDPALLDLGGGIMVDAKYKTLGGEKGLLGAATGPIQAPAYQGIDNQVSLGLEQDYANGSIFWTPDTPACMLNGPVLAKFRDLRAHGDYTLGFPSTDVLQTVAVTEGQYAKFQNGSIFSLPATGAWSLLDPISSYYFGIGDVSSWIGFPIADTRPSADKVGRMSAFQQGVIYWSPAGTYALRGPILAEWNSMEAETGLLGYPTGEQSAPDGSGAAIQSFQNGAITSHPNVGAHSIYGSFYQRWNEFGGTAGSLGLPKENQWQSFYCPEGSCSSIQAFSKGALVGWNRPDHPYMMSADIFAYWYSLNGSIGDDRPTNDQQINRDGVGRYISLENGSWIVSSDASGAHTIDPNLIAYVLFFAPCTGYPENDTDHNADHNYWAAVNSTTLGCVIGIHNGDGKPQVFCPWGRIYSCQ